MDRDIQIELNRWLDDLDVRMGMAEQDFDLSHVQVLLIVLLISVPLGAGSAYLFG